MGVWCIRIMVGIWIDLFVLWFSDDCVLFGDWMLRKIDIARVKIVWSGVCNFGCLYVLFYIVVVLINFCFIFVNNICICVGRHCVLWWPCNVIIVKLYWIKIIFFIQEMYINTMKNLIKCNKKMMNIIIIFRKFKKTIYWSWGWQIYWKFNLSVTR